MERSPLTLFRRHKKGCKITTATISHDAKRLYMACDCPIWVHGYVGDLFIERQSLGTNDIDIAEAQRQAFLAKMHTASGLVPSLEPDYLRISECRDKFIIERATKISDRPVGQYKFLLDAFKTFCDARTLIFAKDLTVDVIEDFKVSHYLPGKESTTRANAFAKLRCFLREAFRREWIAKPLAEQVNTYAAEPEQKLPYTDVEVAAILDGALKLNRGRGGYASHPETFRLLLELMLETGMRVSDALHFDPSRLVKGDSMWIYGYVQTKRKRGSRVTESDAYIPVGLKDAIDKCKWLSPTKPFWTGEQVTHYRLGYQVYDLMQQIGKRCDPKVDDCRPHRLRDTFAVRALRRGIAIGDVSRLLGHSSVRITERYYAKWTPERASRLERIMAQSLHPESGSSSPRPAQASSPLQVQ